jgi:hypothetical protein
MTFIQKYFGNSGILINELGRSQTCQKHWPNMFAEHVKTCWPNMTSMDVGQHVSTLQFSLRLIPIGYCEQPMRCIPAIENTFSLSVCPKSYTHFQKYFDISFPKYFSKTTYFLSRRTEKKCSLSLECIPYTVNMTRLA